MSLHESFLHSTDTSPAFILYDDHVCLCFDGCHVTRKKKNSLSGNKKKSACDTNMVCFLDARM